MNKPPIKYVCGFLFDDQLDRVALIRKTRGPNGMAGKLNGIGGKIERGETPRGAQSREFMEETGVFVHPLDWMCFHTERYWQDSGSTVYFMAAKHVLLPNVRTVTDETVHVIGCTTELLSLFHSRQGSHEELLAPEYLRSKIAPPMYNLEYLIPMAMSWLRSPLDRYMEN